MSADEGAIGEEECLEPEEGLCPESEAYYRLLDEQMKNMLKDTEKKLESVRKERNSVISSIENIVKQTYQGQNS